MLTYASSLFLIIPSVIIIFREIVISSLRQLLVEKEGENPIKVTFLAKLKTSIQLFTISIYLFGLAFKSALLGFISATFRSGLTMDETPKFIRYPELCLSNQHPDHISV